MEKNRVLLIIATLILLVCCSGVQGTASNLLRLEGSCGWTQHIKVVQGATAYLVVLPSKEGTGVLIDRYPDGSEHNHGYYFFGYDRLLFNANAPGRHVLSYIINHKESNTVVIDVIGTCAPTDHPTPRVATQKVTLEPTVTFPSPATLVSLSRGIPSAVNCDDGNPCTVDSCSPEGCVHAPVNCDDGNPCTVDSCGPNGCEHVPDAKCNKQKAYPWVGEHLGVDAWYGAFWYTGVYTPKWPQSTNPYIDAKFDGQKAYPWAGKHLGVDAWYGAFWYTEVYTPKWP